MGASLRDRATHERNQSSLFPPSVSVPSAVPAITLWQPWASLIFSGHKLFETRSFRPPLKYTGGFIAIHAAAALPAMRHISEELAELCYDAFGCSWNYSLPRGAVLGFARISGAVPTGEHAPFVSEDEIAAGDWTPGRWAWPLCDIQALPTPVPAKGKQGWWRFDASAGEAGTATTPQSGVVHEHAASEAGDAR